MIGDLIAVVAAAVASCLIYQGLFLRDGVYGLGSYFPIAAVCFLNLATIGIARGAYGLDRLAHLRRQLPELIGTWAIVAALSLTLAFAFKVSSDISRGTVGLFFIAAPVLLIAWRYVSTRMIAHAMASGAIRNRNVILIADRQQLIRSDAARGIEKAGYAPSAVLSYAADTGPKALADLALQAVAIARRDAIDAILILADWSDTRTIEHLAVPLRVLPLPVYLLPDRSLTGLLSHGTTSIAGVMAADLQRAPLSIAERAAKRTFDIIFASAGLLVMSPLLIMVAILIKLDSAGTVFFHQTRNGFNDRPFRIVKFRSMRVAEDGKEIRQARIGDERTTKIGRIIRKTSIDELPQLWNVLKGDMSIVGPRPHAAAHNEDYQRRIGSYCFRHHVRPGLTGWAQINGCRGETDTLAKMERRVEFDLFYINHWSLWLDLRIVLGTLRLLVKDPAAY